MNNTDVMNAIRYWLNSETGCILSAISLIAFCWSMLMVAAKKLVWVAKFLSSKKAKPIIASTLAIAMYAVITIAPALVIIILSAGGSGFWFWLLQFIAWSVLAGTFIAFVVLLRLAYLMRNKVLMNNS